MRPQAPCKDCEKRELGCHGKCAEYQAFREEQHLFDLQMAKIRECNVYFDDRVQKCVKFRNKAKRK